MNTISPFGVSVVICCYNSATRLPRTLRYIAKQNVPGHIPWEIIVVDNASTDDTAGVAQEVWNKTGCMVPFRILKQPIPGLFAAREKGFEKSRHEFLIFCDDDNWLQKDYVGIVHDVMHHNSVVAVLGGQGEAMYEVKPSGWFKKYDVYFAVGPQGKQTGDVTNTKGYVYGAAFVVRKSAWKNLHQHGYVSRLTGRKGNSLAGSEDRELCYALRLIGYKIWYHDKLKFKHYIPRGRTDWNYFLRLIETIHRSRPQMDAYMAVLKGSVPSGSLRWQWLWKCITILRQLKSPKFLISAANGREGSDSVVRWRQLCGEWKGWWSIREGYIQLYESAQKLQAAKGKGENYKKSA